jgi:hypothetical protein
MKKYTSILEAAKAYVAQGFSVIPIRNGEKRPSIEWDIYQDRRPTDQEIIEWFSGTDNQIGIVTGRVSSGRFIVDFDGEKWDEGFTAFMEDFPELLETLIVETGSGRSHVWATCVMMPSDLGKVIYKHVCGKDEQGYDIVDYQIELRCNGHQTLCPPSRHPSGNYYKWVDESKPLIALSEERFKELVQWMHGHPDKAGKAQPQTPPAGPVGPAVLWKAVPQYRKPSAEEFAQIDALLTDDDRDRLAHYYLIRAVRDMKNGQYRNDTGHQFCCELHNVGLNRERAYPLMENYQAQVPQEGKDPYTLREAKATVDSVYAHHERNLPNRINLILKYDDKTGAWSSYGSINEPDAEKILGFNLTEAGNAECFKYIFGDVYCYIPEVGGWYGFDTVRWDEAEAEIHCRMVELMRAKSRCAVLGIQDPEKVKKHMNWCLSSESDSRVYHSLHMAQNYLPRKREFFELDNYMLGVRNGVVDLRTGEFRAARPEDYLLKNTDIEFNPEAKCPIWMNTVTEIFGGDLLNLA